MIVFPTLGDERIVLKESEIGSYLMQTWAKEIRAKADGFGKYPIPFVRQLLAQGLEQFQWQFSTAYTDDHIDVILGGLVDFEFRDQREWLEPFAQRLRELAIELYPKTRSHLVSVDERGQWLDVSEVARRKLKHINWVNIFGPSYVAKFGHAFLLGLPGYRTEEWPDGSIYHQLSPTFVTDDPKAAKALQKQVVDYCAQAGLKVTCKAPYQLPRAQPTRQAPAQQPEEAEEPIPDISVQIYMQEILGTTLLLDDGTRVKPVAVPWEALTPVQVEIALTAIKAVAIDEIRQHRDQRIRFEFNELPEALDALMADLVGRDNPDFEYVQVDMGM